jgi:AhpD family alkylhydroperoxidase
LTPFKKRAYSDFGAFVRDLREAWNKRALFKPPMGVKGMAPDFQERVFLAETEVNGCRFCAYAHSRAAFKEGVSREEIQELLKRNWGHVPEPERAAIAYAQHWAESDGRPDVKAAEKLRAEYGDASAAQIEYALLLMRICNFIGNFVDLCLFKVSAGRFGH